MTVSEILLNFRDSLIAVVPAMERVGVPWRPGQAYDEWDAIASALFQALVADVLCWKLPGAGSKGFRLPEYDMMMDSYAGMSTIEVIHPEILAGRCVFHSFETQVAAFDVVAFRQVSANGIPVRKTLETCPVDQAAFQLRLESSSNDEVVIREISSS